MGIEFGIFWVKYETKEDLDYFLHLVKTQPFYYRVPVVAIMQIIRITDTEAMIIGLQKYVDECTGVFKNIQSKYIKSTTICFNAEEDFNTITYITKRIKIQREDNETICKNVSKTFGSFNVDVTNWVYKRFDSFDFEAIYETLFINNKSAYKTFIDTFCKNILKLEQIPSEFYTDFEAINNYVKEIYKQKLFFKHKIKDL